MKNANPNNYLFNRKESKVLQIRGVPKHIDELVEILVDELSVEEIFPVGTKVVVNFYGDDYDGTVVGINEETKEYLVSWEGLEKDDPSWVCFYEKILREG